MKMKLWRVAWGGRDEIVARFGAARVIRQSPVRFWLEGGTAAERSQAQDWFSLFFHEAILAGCRPARGGISL